MHRIEITLIPDEAVQSVAGSTRLKKMVIVFLYSHEKITHLGLFSILVNPTHHFFLTTNSVMHCVL